MANALTEPPFAANPPVKVNINAKTLGLVLMILGIIGLIFAIIGLLTIFGFCGGFGVGLCGFPIIWLLGDLVGLAGLVIGTIGAYRMYQGLRQGKDWVIYGLALGLLGALIGLIGNIMAYSGLLGFGAGAIVGFIIDLIIYFIVYYLVVISRFPGEAPLVATPGGYGGYGAPPPPPPSA